MQHSRELAGVAERLARVAALAQPLCAKAIVKAGIVPGMRVVELGSRLGDLAFLVAERVGTSGHVLGIEEDERLVRIARARAAQQRFAQVDFRAVKLDRLAPAQPVDAVIARFYLGTRPNPVATIRRAAALVCPGGRLVFVEWHFESMRWAQTGAYPELPLYTQFAAWTLEALRRSGAHPAMGLGLVNAFAAGLPLPATRAELRTVAGAGHPGYAFFEDLVRQLAPAIGPRAFAGAAEIAPDGLAARLEREIVAARGHAFLPMQVAAWTRTTEDSRDDRI
ncbi:MAG: methyltransferase domain-containing protein [Vulcanimicrobiaceae bacterium]